MSLATGSKLNAETFQDFVQRLRHHVRGEGVAWHHTADAMFTVQARKIIFGIDPDYTDKLAVGIEDSMYFSPKEYWDSCDESFQAKLDGIALKEHDIKFMELTEGDQWEIIGDLPDHTVSGWDDRWEIVNSHFTKEAAEAFIKRKKHDYHEGLRVYVEAQVYCWEFNELVAGLMDGRIAFNGPIEISQASRDVLAERQRQVAVKDWTPEHDDAHPNGEIAAFAAVYAMPPAAREWPAEETGYGLTFGTALCPQDWQPKFGDRRRELVKAGALILAEIERIDRATAKGEGDRND